MSAGRRMQEAGEARRILTVMRHAARWSPAR